MLSYELLKHFYILEQLLVFIFRDCMAGHRNIHRKALSLHFRIYLSDSHGSYRRLEIVFSSAIFESKQALTHRIAIANTTIIDKCELGVAPAEQIPGDLAS